MKPLILASSSPYRRGLLARLQLPFVSSSPDIDETLRIGETPQHLVVRLATAKAHAVAQIHSRALIIGSDQCVVLNGHIFGKPGNYETAHAQLCAVSGQALRILTSVCLLDTESGACPHEVVPYRVRFRVLDEETIKNYLRLEHPYDCAGSVKSEGLGASLLEYMRGDDPTALIGLPLIRLCTMLCQAGVKVPPNAI